MLKIDLTDLLRKVGNEADLEEEETVSYPEDNLVLSQPIKVKMHLTNTGDSILLQGEIKTEIVLTCARCLNEYPQPIVLTIKEEFSPKKSYLIKAKEIELKEGDFIFGVEKDNTLNLSEVTRQNLLVNLPIKPLCRPDCQAK